MNKTTLKNFAINARLELLARVRDRAALYGITEEKVKSHELARSEQFQKLGGDMLTQREIAQRNALISRVSARGFNQAMEEAAYTWFNRFIALRYMQAHNLLPVDVPVLPMAAGELPQIVRQAQNVTLEGVDIALVADMLDNNRTEELYKYLLIALCNALSEPLPQMFEAIEDYTELLFPDGILKAESVLGMLAGVEPDNWQDIQVIGWLYQYYNTELKQETFDLLKKNVKITKDRIGAATQLFTPEWIVNYMVENSLGRLWLEGHPDRNLRMKWRYYMDEAEQTPEVAAQLAELRKGYADRQPETITVLDPCMGSGHILVYAFDVLMDIYRSRGYTDRDAVQSIVTNNLYGLDIDDRAAQLAYFAVMMKACEYDRRFLRRGIQPQVCAIQESPNIDLKLLDSFGPDAALAKKLHATFIDAKEYGSILRVDLTEDELRRLSLRVMQGSTAAKQDGLVGMIDVRRAINAIAPLVKQAIIMARKYDVVVTNPPYMGASGIGEKLSKFVKDNYPDSKSDLFAVFIEKCRELTCVNGFQAMITQPSFLFLSSFEKLRCSIVGNNAIYSLLHMGRGIFGIDFGSTAFVLRNTAVAKYTGKYYRLHERTFQYIDPDDICKIFLQSKKNPMTKVDFQSYETGKEVPFCDNNDALRVFYTAKQENFKKIPGMPVAYWVSDHIIRLFSKPTIGAVGSVVTGMTTADNERFLRTWHEIEVSKMSLCNGRKWYPYQKGGDYRKWYGNNTFVVNWENNGYAIKHNCDSIGNVRSGSYNEDRILNHGLTWTYITSGSLGVRFVPNGYLFDNKGSMIFFNSEIEEVANLAFLCSCVAEIISKMLNPTISFQPGNMASMPAVSLDASTDTLINYAKQCIALSREDWDSYEASWDFQCHPMIL